MKQTFLSKLYKLLSEGYNLLLIFLILLLTFRPVNAGFIYIAAWELCFAAVFFMAIFVISHHKWVRNAAIVTGVPALIMDWVGLYMQTPTLIFPAIVLTIVFMLICTLSVFYHEILVSRASWHSLTPVICAYFLIGFAFAYSFLLIEFLYPGTIKVSNPDATFLGHGEYLSAAVTWSFASLLALNGLDASDLPFMQTLMLVEGMLAQFYLAALTSRIVSIYRASRKEQEKKKDAEA